MGKKKNKKMFVSTKEQRNLQEQWREFFSTGGNGDIPCGKRDEEEKENTKASEFINAIASRFGFTPMMDSSEEPEELENQEIENNADEYESENDSDGILSFDNREDDVEAGEEDEVILPSKLMRSANNDSDDEIGRTKRISGILTSNAVEVFKNIYETLFFFDRERSICIDTRELNINEESQFVTKEQVRETFTFFIINSRPDAIFTMDEFINLIYKKYESASKDNFAFVKDGSYIFAYHIDDDVYEAWEDICDELRSSGKLYDLCNTLSKKCSGKHYRMNHSRAYISFWNEVSSEEINRAEETWDDKSYFLELMKVNEFDTCEWENGPVFVHGNEMEPGHFEFIEYWDFYKDFKTKYFAKASSEKDISEQTKNLSMSLNEDKVKVSQKKEETVTTQIEVQAKKVEETKELTEEVEVSEAEEPELSEDDLLMNYDGKDNQNSIGTFAVHRKH